MSTARGNYGWFGQPTRFILRVFTIVFANVVTVVSIVTVVAVVAVVSVVVVSATTVIVSEVVTMEDPWNVYKEYLYLYSGDQPTCFNRRCVSRHAHCPFYSLAHFLISGHRFYVCYSNRRLRWLAFNFRSHLFEIDFKIDSACAVQLSNFRLSHDLTDPFKRMTALLYNFLVSIKPMQNSVPDSQTFSTDPVAPPSVEELTPDQRAQKEKEQAAKQQRFEDIMAHTDNEDRHRHHFLFVPNPNDRLFDSDVERYRINSAAHKIMQDRVFRACIDGKPLTYFQLVEGLPLCLGEGYNLPPVRRDVWESIAGKGLYYTLFEKFLRVSMRFMDIKSYTHCGCLITSVVTRGTLDIDCDYEYLSSMLRHLRDNHINLAKSLRLLLPQQRYKPLFEEQYGCAAAQDYCQKHLSFLKRQASPATF